MDLECNTIVKYRKLNTVIDYLSRKLEWGVEEMSEMCVAARLLNVESLLIRENYKATESTVIHPYWKNHNALHLDYIQIQGKV